MSMDEAKEYRMRKRLKEDFPFYAQKCLFIRTKAGEILPFCLNQAQRYIHAQVEKQREETGKVRVIILKGRQQGCSTYVEGRSYWRTTHKRGIKTFILTHSDDATTNIFNMAKRFHDECPPPVKPEASFDNAKELYFSKLDSGYKVGTAGSKAVGRGDTIQLFHGSEVAFWPNAKTHASGILQAIASEPGTEIFLESTANGVGNYFHKIWQAAEAGQSEFRAIFVPWYWTDEYRMPVPADFKMTQDELEYKSAYNLDDEQIVWRRNKIIELEDPLLFKQEYPATAAEAFQSTGADPYIPIKLVTTARKVLGVAGYGPVVLGVDPARYGDDRTAICCRQGRIVKWIRSYSKISTMQVVGHVRKAIEDEGAEKVFIDVVGLGAGVYDRLAEMYDESMLEAVASGESAMDENRYFNKRAEMWGEMKKWLEAQPAQIPDSDELQADLTQIKYSYDSNNALKMERKEDMKKRGVRSPDMADALCLTFAIPILKPKPKPEPFGHDFEMHDPDYGY